MKINNPKEFKFETGLLISQYASGKEFVTHGMRHNQILRGEEGKKYSDWDYVQSDISLFSDDEVMEAANYYASHKDEIIDGFRDVEKSVFFDCATHGLGTISIYVKTRVFDFGWTFNEYIKNKDWYQNCNDFLKMVLKFTLLVKIVNCRHPYQTSLHDGKVMCSKTDEFDMLNLVQGCFRCFINVMNKTLKLEGYPQSENALEKFEESFKKNLKLDSSEFKTVDKVFKTSYEIFVNNIDEKDENGKNMLVLGSKKFWDENPD